MLKFNQIRLPLKLISWKWNVILWQLYRTVFTFVQGGFYSESPTYIKKNITLVSQELGRDILFSFKSIQWYSGDEYLIMYSFYSGDAKINLCI